MTEVHRITDTEIRSIHARARKLRSEAFRAMFRDLAAWARGATGRQASPTRGARRAA